jgi:hypothetical protein
MNFDEVMELHRAVTAFCLQNSRNYPKLGVYDIQSRDLGYFLCVKANSCNDGFLEFLKTIAKVHLLELRRFRGYFVLHSLGGWDLREDLQ